MFVRNATDVRKEWSSVLDAVIREKPQFIRRTRDYLFLTDVKLLDSLLSLYAFTADEYRESNGSVTLSLNELDLVENGADEADAKLKLARAILDYAEDFYGEFDLWSSAPNRKAHIPYVFKALLLNDAQKMGDLIQCRPGKS